LLKLLNRWREEAEKAGHRIERIAIAFEAGRDGFWLARWLRARGIEAHVIHASSVAVSRDATDDDGVFCQHLYRDDDVVLGLIMRYYDDADVRLVSPQLR
jgi:hypothetical protein